MYMFVVAMQVHANKYKKENTWVVVHSVISYHFFVFMGGGLAVLTYQSGYVFPSGVSNRILDYFLQVQFNSLFYKDWNG